MRIPRACTLFLALFGLLPATLLAQGRGVMGGRGALTPGRGQGSLAREAGIQIPKYVNSVNLLIEHRQDLALTDSQFVRLIVMKRTFDSTNTPLLAEARFRAAGLQERRSVVQLSEHRTPGLDRRGSLLCQRDARHGAREYQRCARPSLCHAVGDAVEQGSGPRGQGGAGCCGGKRAQRGRVGRGGGG